MGSDYEILTEKDMPYFRELVDKGQAVIIEIPEDVLMDIDIGEFEEDKEAAKITDEELLDYINRHKEAFIAAADRNEQIMEETRRLEEELMGTQALPEMEEEEQIKGDIMPVAPLPSSIAADENRSATRAERETPMRDEEWKKAGGPTSREMLDTYEKEEEEQRLIRERRLRLRMQREAQRRNEETEAAESDAGRYERRDPSPHEAPDTGSAAESGGKMPPTPAQLLEAKKKARQLGYTGNIPMEVLMMLLDVSDEEETKQEEANAHLEEPEKDISPAVQDSPEYPVRHDGNGFNIKPGRHDEEDNLFPVGGTDEDIPADKTDEIENAKDAAFLRSVEESMEKNSESMRTMRTEEEEKDRKEDIQSPAEDNPYTGEDAQLYREVIESGQFAEEDIRFVMENQIPTDYKRQLFMKMLEDKMDEDED